MKSTEIACFPKIPSHPTRVRGLKQTRLMAQPKKSVPSHPTRVRGLKRTSSLPPILTQFVAPHAGAWIETIRKNPYAVKIVSHPTRVRGLKPRFPRRHVPANMSHPTRVRGLKPLRCGVNLFEQYVAPHAGAWIETPKPAGLNRKFCSRTPRGCDRALSVRQTGKPVFGEKRRKKTGKRLEKRGIGHI